MLGWGRRRRTDDYAHDFRRYFAQGAFTYHDLAGNASRIHKNGLYAPPALDLIEG